MIQRLRDVLGGPSRLHRMQLFSQMALLLKAGIHLLRSLEICGAQTADPVLARALDQMSIEVRSGARLSQAMELSSRAFTTVHSNAVRAAEIGGHLPRTFEDLARWEEREDRLHRDLRAALTYPVLVVVLSLAGVLLLVKFLLPVVRSVLAQSGKPPSAPTRVLLFAGDILDRPLYLGLALLLVGVLGWSFHRFFRRPGPRLWWHRTRHRLPLIGGLFRKAVLIRVCRTLGSLLEAGVPLDRALELTGGTAGSVYVTEAMLVPASGFIRRGETLSQALAGADLPPSFHGMVGVGEQSGMLPALLARIGDLYEAELRLDLQTFVKIVEPAAIGAVGLLVLGILICAFLPLYDLLAGVGLG